MLITVNRARNKEFVIIPHLPYIHNSFLYTTPPPPPSPPQNNTPGVGGSSLTAQDLQGWITAYRSFLKTNMGNFLLRSGRDEPLLLGDLHIVVSSLKGLRCPASE